MLWLPGSDFVTFCFGEGEFFAVACEHNCWFLGPALWNTKIRLLSGCKNEADGELHTGIAFLCHVPVIEGSDSMKSAIFR